MKRSLLARAAVAGLVLAGCGGTDTPRGEQAHIKVLAMDASQMP